jgi:hypothetical protein
MHPPVDQDLKAIVKEALEEAERIHGATNAEQLGKRYGLSSKTVSFLRNGRWTRTDRLLIAALLRRRLDVQEAA